MDPTGATRLARSPAESPGEWPAGWHVHHLSETGSTNTDVLRMAAEGAADRTVLYADHQTAGRGRLDRRWEAPAGFNLLVSILFRNPPVHRHELTQRVALAAADAALDVGGVQASLKWPNDLMVGEAKLAGVLAQGAGDHVVVGLGLNVGWAPPGAARLGDKVSVGRVLSAVLSAYDRLPADVHPLYRSRLATIGRHVRVELPGSCLDGRAVDVGPDGRLVVIDDCGITHHVDTGDVVHLR
jgi:BirA family biotin operon repressor/biotin-[acetyl-CoA-carboxylase] ligase